MRTLASRFGEASTSVGDGASRQTAASSIEGHAAEAADRMLRRSLRWCSRCLSRRYHEYADQRQAHAPSGSKKESTGSPKRLVSAS